MFWRARGRNRQNRRSQQTCRQAHRFSKIAAIESLEPRTVLSGVTFVAGVLTVNGTDGNDSIAIARTADGTRVQVTFNGQVITAPVPLLADVNEIKVFGDEGNDLITVRNINKKVTVDGGADMDILN